jgi:hypothetical protein
MASLRAREVRAGGRAVSPFSPRARGGVRTLGNGTCTDYFTRVSSSWSATAGRPFSSGDKPSITAFGRSCSITRLARGRRSTCSAGACCGERRHCEREGSFGARSILWELLHAPDQPAGEQLTSPAGLPLSPTGVTGTVAARRPATRHFSAR